MLNKERLKEVRITKLADASPMAAPASRSWTDTPAVILDRPRRYLVWLSGHDPELLSHCPRHEVSHSVRLGLTMFIPCGLGFFSAAYTAQSLLAPMSVAIACGALWGSVVLVIDVAIMSALRSGQATEQDEAVIAYRPFSRITVPMRRFFRRTNGGRMSFVIPVTRVLLAGGMGVLMSHTLILGLFRDKITTEIRSARDAELKRIDDDWRTEEARLDGLRPKPVGESGLGLAAGSREIAALKSHGEDWKAQQHELEKAVDDLRAKIVAKTAEAQRESHGENLSRLAGEGPIYRSLMKQVGDLTNEYEAKQRELAEIPAKLRELDEQGAKVAEQNAAANAAIEVRQREDFLNATAKWEHERDQERKSALEARSQVGGETRADVLFQTEALDGLIQQNRAMSDLYWLLMFVLISLDTLPLFLKLFRHHGVYDSLVGAQDRIAQTKIADEVRRHDQEHREP